MEIKRRNRVETQRGNEESEEGKREGREDGETRRSEDKEELFLVPFPLFPLSPHRPVASSPVSYSPSNSLPDSVPPRGCGLGQERGRQ